MESDKIKRVIETGKPQDDAGIKPPATLETDLSGVSYFEDEIAKGYRHLRNGRRVLVDTTGTEIRCNSRRPLEFYSGDEWKKVPKVVNAKWGEARKEIVQAKAEMPQGEGG